MTKIEKEFDLIGYIAHGYNLFKLFSKFLMIAHIVACI